MSSQVSLDSSIGTQEEIPSGGEKVSKGISSLTVQNIATSALGFVFLGALWRLLPGIQYGIYSAVSISVSVAASFATFGLQYAAARYVSLADREMEFKNGTSRKIMILSLIVSGVASVFFIACSPVLSVFFSKSTTWTPIFVLGGLWLFSSSISAVLQGIIEGMKRYTTLATILLLSKIAMVALTIVGLLLFRSVSIPIIGWVVYSVIIVAWAASILGLRMRAPTMKSRTYGEILRYSCPLGIATALTVISSNADLIVVGGYLNPLSLGVYNTAVIISSSLTLILMGPLTTAILPEAASSLQDSRRLSNIFRLSLRFVLLAVLPASFLVAAISPQILIIFSGGAKYLGGVQSLELISIFYVFVAIQLVAYSILQAEGRTVEVLILSGFTTALELGVAIALVPHLGIEGAAIARAVAALMGAFPALYLVLRGLDRVPLDRASFYFRSIICSAVPLAVVWALSSFVSWEELTAIPYTIIGAGIFFLCVRALGVLNDEDCLLLKHALPRSASKLLKDI